MPDVHTIRLARPWQIEQAGRARRAHRAFHQPTGLEENEHVVLVVDARQGGDLVSLNGQPVGRTRPGTVRIDITDRLQPYNRLEIASGEQQVDEVTAGSDDSGGHLPAAWIAGVWLEIGFATRE